MKSVVVLGFFSLLSVAAQAELYPADVEVRVPAEVYRAGGQRVQPCNRCCVYRDQNYSEGAIISVGSVLLQCQRDEKTVSTNPLIWRRLAP